MYGEIRWNTVKLMSKMYHEQFDSIMESKYCAVLMLFIFKAGFGDLQRVEVVLSGSLSN